MLSIKYLDKTPETPTGKIRVELFDWAKEFLSESELPYKAIFRNDLEVFWEIEVHPGTFHEIITLDREMRVEVYDRSRNLVSRYAVDNSHNMDVCYQAFLSWCKKNPGSKGLAIGVHNGRDGEWVRPVRNYMVRAVLVEASEPQFSDLSNYYKTFSNVWCERNIITPNGGTVIFHEGGPGLTNSVVEGFTEKYVGEKNTKKRTVSSISINEIIERHFISEKLGWLHLDVEGIDDELIMAFDFERFGLPEIIIWESFNLSEERRETLEKFLKNLGYYTKNDYFNSVSIIKK